MEAKIYVACLASYNNGTLFGKWIDVSSDAEEMQEEIQAMLEKSPVRDAEEFAIHDHENCSVFNVGEYTSISELAKLMEFVEDCYDEDLACACLDLAVDLEEAKDLLDRHIGTANTFQDYAEDLADECMLHEVPDNIKMYFDYERFARDLEHDYQTTEYDGMCYIFHY